MGDGYRELRTDPAFGKTLEKLPLVTGKCWRGTRVTQEEMAKLKVGSIYKFTKFSSSSQRRDVAEGLMYNKPKKVAMLMEIDDSARKIPRPIAQLAASEEEAEVVMMTGDQYKVTSVKPEEDFYRVKMSHVSA